MSFPLVMATRYAGAIRAFQADKHIFDLVILYEDLKENPEETLLSLFELLNIDKSHLTASLSAMKRDSQNDNSYQFTRKLYNLESAEEEKLTEIFELFKVGHISLKMSLDDFRQQLQLRYSK